MRKHENAAIFYSSHNTHGKKDATGAFIPESKRFAKHVGAPAGSLVGVNCCKTPKTARRRIVVENMNRIYQDRGPLDTVAFFCHGWPTGIQFGWNNRDVGYLAEILTWNTVENPTIILYACLAADDGKKNNNRNYEEIGPGTDGGFADLLRDRLWEYGAISCRVVAHKTAGHATWNPFAVAFDADGNPYGNDENPFVGGRWFISPNDPRWSIWRRKLRKNTYLRYQFPFMSNAEVDKIVDAL